MENHSTVKRRRDLLKVDSFPISKRGFIVSHLILYVVYPRKKHKEAVPYEVMFVGIHR